MAAIIPFPAPQWPECDPEALRAKYGDTPMVNDVIRLFQEMQVTHYPPHYGRPGRRRGTGPPPLRPRAR